MPTKLEFQEVLLETPGYFSFSETQGDNCESTITMDAMVENFIDMENLIQKNLLSPSEKLN